MTIEAVYNSDHVGLNKMAYERLKMSFPGSGVFLYL